MSKVTPMMKQYLRIKAAHQDAFLFFRLGDFYELFYDDAIKAAQELEITLTKRDSSSDEPIPMCGVPHHSADRYIKTLVDKGYKVAICEQVEDPKDAKGVVKREVVRIITPGMLMDASMLEDVESNYIASVTQHKPNEFVIVYHELSTGESQLLLIEQSFDAVLHELGSRQVKEVVLASDFPRPYQKQIKKQLQALISYEDDVKFIGEFRDLYDELDDERYVHAFSRMLNYIEHTQKRSLQHLQKPTIIELQQHLNLDMYSKRNLELTETILKKSKYGSLLWVLDRTVTAMGARNLKKWIERPLINEAEINRRLERVEVIKNHFLERDELRELLTDVYDLERLAGRVSFGNVNARDLIQLKQSLQTIPQLQTLLEKLPGEEWKQVRENLSYPQALVDLLERSIVDEPPISVTEGNIIKTGFNEKLDTYRKALTEGKQWILQLEAKEREKTGIKSLKVGFNKVFGYYIEVTHANKELVPEDRYERKQTLRNAERYITPELKEKEAIILEAEEKSVDLEYELFVMVREKVKAHIDEIQRIAQIISDIDCIQSFAEVSERNNYTRPTFSDSEVIIEEGRHPVIEQVLEDGMFVPNDVYLNESCSILLITGPNMSGKSTYMRQVALINIMAQIGCFVPAERAQLTIYDQIFTRIGAADDLVRGQSTFMVEMLEAKHALTNATKKSLILLDEIGRGTSTYDGMALAQAIVEYIHNEIGAKTLFSTHYHELTALEEQLDRVKNVYVRAEEYEDEVVFLHKVEEGRAEESYGIQVAKLADLPESLIKRAQEILHGLEKEEDTRETPAYVTEQGQLSFFVPEEKKEAPPELPQQVEKVLKQLESLNLLEMTPLDALNTLYSLQKSIKKLKE